MGKFNITESFILDEIEENMFSEKEISLFHTCIKATNCIGTAGDIVAYKEYKDYIKYIDSYVELAETLVYKAESIKDENSFIKELRFLLSGITLDGNLYKPTLKQELDIQMYLNSYGWVVNEQHTIAVNLDVDVLDLDHLTLLA